MTTTAARIDGKAIAESIRADIKKQVEAIVADQQQLPPAPAADAPAPEVPAGAGEFSPAGIEPTTLIPGLAVIIVGSRGDSQTYVRLKRRAAAECLFRSLLVELPDTITTDALVAEVRKLNDDPRVHGLLVQLPLPKHVDDNAVLDAICPEKDVDGLHPVNVGNLYLRDRAPLHVPCTPQGVITLLKRSNVPIAGKRAVVLGRSNIVGLPVAQLLLNENATVTTCHSRSSDLPGICREADIVVAAVGKPGLVQRDWIKPGAVVIDVGTNSIPDATKKSGQRLVGDVDFEGVSQVASQITPVPGGCGPMTVALLLQNTINAFKHLREMQNKSSSSKATAATSEAGGGAASSSPCAGGAGAGAAGSCSWTKTLLSAVVGCAVGAVVAGFFLKKK